MATNHRNLLFSLALLFLTFYNLECRVHMRVLYETFCPDSLKFLSDLVDNFDAIRDRVQLELVPFGKARISSSSGAVVCQHGPSECHGNALHACLLAQTSQNNNNVLVGDGGVGGGSITVNQTLDFLDCWSNEAFNYYDKPFELGQKCANESGLAFEYIAIEKCARSSESNELIRRASALTPSNIDYVPTVFFNRIFKARDTSWVLFDDLPATLDRLESRMKHRD